MVACMRAYFLITLLSLYGYQSANAQPGAETVLSEIESKLKTGSAKVSAILTDTKYVLLHPETPFRELIKKYCTPDPVKIAADAEPGKKVKVLASLKDEDGKSIAGAVVYFYQTDAKGWYAADQPHVGGNSGDQRHARIFGYTKTDAAGKFEVHTVKPSGYPQSDLPAHIHVEVHDLPGYQTMITEFLFDDDDRLVGNIRASAQRNHFMIAKPEKTNPPFQQQFSYTITLQRN
jgi:protocatechuate 3,4-dioxygenase beta subunit